jgi:Flp pilus assembly protein TadD
MGRRQPLVKFRLLGAALAWIGLAGPALVAAAPGTAADDRPAAVRSPEPYAVLAFTNLTPHGTMEWLRVAVPFLLAERLEAHRGLRPVYGPLVLPDGQAAVDEGEAAVARLARATGARLIWRGSLERAPNWDLVSRFELWRVGERGVTRVGHVEQHTTYSDVQRATVAALETLCAQAGYPVAEADLVAVRRPATTDHYAFTLFGRGLLAMHGLGHGADRERASANLAKAVFIDPKLAEAHRLLGELALHRSEPRAAGLAYARALAVREDYLAAMAGLARLAHEEGRPGEARELVERMLVRRPWDTELRFLAGKLLWEVGESDAAFVQLRRVVEADADHVEARRILVLIHAARGEGGDLVTELEALAALNPNDVSTLLDLAAAHAAVDQTEQAIAMYETVLHAHPRHLQALKFVADLYRRTGDLDRALAYYWRALSADANDPRAYFLLGETYVAKGDDHSAKRIFLRAQRFKEYLPEVYNNLGAILYREGRLGEALWYLKRATDRRPDNPRFRYNYALGLSAKRRPTEALAQIDYALSIEAEDPELHYLRGVVLLRLGDADGARTAFARTLELAPDHAAALHNQSLLDDMRRRAAEGEIVREVPRLE